MMTINDPKCKINRVVLAYSGGLDTSVILQWLRENYDCDIITFTADIGQGEEIKPARERALQLGISESNIILDDLRHEFVSQFVFPMFRANALYEGVYLLGTAIARPLIAQRQIELARIHQAEAVAHGATGKGNDQVRFELAYYALQPDIKVIAPWREWKLDSRQALVEYAKTRGIPLALDDDTAPPYSTDANLLHTSYEGGVLEDPSIEANESIFTRSIAPELAPDQPTYITLDFEHGDPVALDGKPLEPHTLLEMLNTAGGANGIGRVDMVESRFVGIKSRGVYETPGGTILLAAHRAIESLTLDRETIRMKDALMPDYAALIYNGLWFTPERQALQALIDHTQQPVTGSVRMKLYKGMASVVGRRAPHSLYSRAYSTFEADQVYDQRWAEGFIQLHALRLRLRSLAGFQGLPGAEQAIPLARPSGTGSLETGTNES